ncbi:hypothetical protein [Methanobacterium sp.]|uniref:hypothetical protein n=1 Tax=Methanobacterium sp. TaxID=2164 RepID=UPI003C712C7A
MLPEEFHELGKTLLEEYSTLCKDDTDTLLTEECIFRVIIDRFYYSAFLTAKEWLIQNSCYQSLSENEHANVRMNLKKCKKLARANNLAGLLNRLRKERNIASYHTSGFGYKYTEKYVEEWRITSERFIKNFEI